MMENSLVPPPSREGPRMKVLLTGLGLFVLSLPLFAQAPKAAEKKLHHLTTRASVIDKRVKECPDIGFVFTDAKGKALDAEHAVLDTRVAPKGKLVIWL